MAYNFSFSDGRSIRVDDNQAGSVPALSIDIPGRNLTNYGRPVAEAFVKLLEHFAAPNAPINPTRGQIWYNTTNAAAPTLFVYDGTTWRRIFSSGSGPFELDTDLIPLADCNGSSYNIGSPTRRFCNVYANVFNGVATSARYADLAERYAADKTYLPGTVLMLGGEQEVTAARETDSVFGVVSTNPAFLMNSEAGNDATHPPVALVGRVPVFVNGPVRKFDYLEPSTIPGVARAVSVKTELSFARSLQASESNGVELIEATIGVK